MKFERKDLEAKVEFNRAEATKFKDEADLLWSQGKKEVASILYRKALDLSPGLVAEYVFDPGVRVVRGTGTIDDLKRYLNNRLESNPVLNGWHSGEVWANALRKGLESFSVNGGTGLDLRPGEAVEDSINEMEITSLNSLSTLDKSVTSLILMFGKEKGREIVYAYLEWKLGAAGSRDVNNLGKEAKDS